MTKVYPPLDWQDFERLCLALFRRHYRHPEAQRLGRQGQKQFGIDIVLLTDKATSVIGIQCKCHSHGIQPTLDEISYEVAKAETFDPPLTSFSFVTTAQRDQGTQRAVLNLSKQRLQAGQFAVDVWFWDDINEILNQYDDIANSYYGGISAESTRQVSKKIDDIHTAVVTDQLQGTTSSIHTEIDLAVKFIENGHPDVAIERLESIQRAKGDILGSYERFRITANLGSAYEVMEEFQTAAKLFHEAKSLQPHLEKAQCLEAIGYIYLNNIDKAYKLVCEIIERFPNYSLGWAIWIRTSADSTSMTTIDTRLPAQLKHDPDIRLALAVRTANQRDFAGAEHLVRELFEQSPTNPKIRGLIAEVLIKQAIFFTDQADLRQAPEWLADKLVEAENHLTELIRALDNRSVVYGKSRLLHLRSQARQLLGNVRDANEDISTSYNLTPQTPEIAFRYALLRNEAGDTEKAIEILRSLIGTPYVQQLEFVLSQIVIRVYGDEGLPEAIQLLERRLEDDDFQSLELVLDYIDLLIDFYSQRSDMPGAISLIDSEETRNRLPRPAFLALRSKVHFLNNDTDLASVVALESNQRIDDTVSDSVQKYIANRLAILRMYGPALTIYKRVTKEDHIGPDTFRLISLAQECSDHDYILSFLNRLRENGLFHDRLFGLEIDLLEIYNSPQTAIARLQEAINPTLNDDFTKRARLHLSLIGIRENQTDLIESDISKLPTWSEVDTVHTGRAVVQSLLHGSNPDNALEYAYHLYRRFPDEMDAHLALISLVLPEIKVSLPSFQVVAPGAAVNYKEEGTDSEAWYVLEDGKNPSMDRHEHSPSHPISLELLGKSVGDTFFLRKGTPQDRKAQIMKIVSKYEYRLSDCCQRFEDRFPGTRVLMRFSLENKDTGEIDVEEFIRIHKRLFEHNEHNFEVYREKICPVYIVAQAEHATVPDTLTELAFRKGFPIKCSQGSNEEFDKADNCMKCANELVIDSTALTTLYLCDAFEVLASFRKAIMVSRGTYDEIRQFLISIESRCTSGKTVQWDGHNICFATISPEAAEEQLRKNRRFLEVLDTHCIVQEGMGLASLKQDEREELLSLFGRPGAESLTLAAAPGRGLWSDDFTHQVKTKFERRTLRIWTQRVFSWLAEIGTIDNEEESQIVLSLVSMGYTHTYMTSEAFLKAGQMADWNPENAPLTAALEWFSTTAMTDQGLAKLIAVILRKMWRLVVFEEQAQAVTIRLLNHVAVRRHGARLIDGIHGAADLIFHLDPVNAVKVKRVIEVWKETITLPPAFIV